MEGQHSSDQNNLNGDTLDGIAEKISRGSKAAGIIVAIAMVVLGILIFMAPIATGIGLAYLVTIGFVAYGIYSIIAYIRTPSELRNGWTLANGIIFTLFGLLVLVEALTQTGGKAQMVSSIAFVIGFFALFQGITQIASYGVFKKSIPQGAGWVMASGIINALLGMLIIFAPMSGWFAMEWVFGIYLIIGGIALFAEVCSGKFAYRQ